MTQEFSRKLAVEHRGPRASPAGHPTGQDITVEANDAELAALAARLQLPAVNALTCRYRLRPAPDGTITAEGWLDALITQTCVVSLDDFTAQVGDHFVIRFVPAGQESDDIDPESIDDIPFSNDTIDLGEVTAEQLALVLDPWPRKLGATLPDATTDEPVSAFAALRAKRPI